jgi:hypothetical protein
VRAPEPVVLQGHGVTLEPLHARHVPALWEAGRDPVVWRWLSVPPPSSLGDSAYYSVLSCEWPEVRRGLQARLTAAATDGPATGPA